MPNLTDADVLKAFEAKADEIAKKNGWSISRAETVMLRYLRDTSPAEAATIAAALTQRTNRRAVNEECCPESNQETTDDGDVIYPDLCHCICHTPND